MSRIKTKPKAWSKQDGRQFRELYPVMNTRELAKLLGREHKSIVSYAKNHGIVKAIARHKYSPKEDRLILKLYPRTLTSAIAKQLGITEVSVYRRALAIGAKKDPSFVAATTKELGRRLGDHPRSVASRFKKGQVPPNKGLRRPGWAPGRMAETQFKKGVRPHTWLPIGSTRFSKEGYLQRKMTDTGYTPRDWRAVHVMLWEESNGPVPPKHMITFKDRDKTNITITNLECISLADNMRRNTIHHLPKPLKEVIVLNANIKRRIRRIEREKQDQRPA